MTHSRPFTFDRVVRIIGGVLLAAGAVWLINVLRNVLLPFCLACLIAYILDPIVEFTRHVLKLKGRGLAIFITLFEVTLAIAVLCYFFIPSVIDEFGKMREIVASQETGHVEIPFVPDSLVEWIRTNLSFDDIEALVREGHLGKLYDTGTSLLSGTVTLVMHTLEWLLTFIYVIFILFDYRHLMKGFRLLVPPKYRPVAYKVGDDIKDSMNHYFRGQAFLALCAAVLYCVGFSIVGIPLAIVLGILVGILYLIPYFQYVTLIPVAIVCYITSLTGEAGFWSLMGQCGLVYVVSQCICDYVLTPKVMGRALGLNPAIILLSLSVWGTLLGLIGMIIALPLTTLLLAYYQEYIINGNGMTPVGGAAAADAPDAVEGARKQ